MDVAAPEDGYFGIKSMNAADKALIRAAAKRAGKDIGTWLGEAARAYVAAERQDMQLTLLPPVQPEVQPALSIAEISSAVELAARIATLRGRTLAPRNKVLTQAARLLHARLTQQSA